MKKSSSNKEKSVKKVKIEKYFNNKSNTAWYKKIDILFSFGVCILVFALSFSILCFFGGDGHFNMALRSSIVITVLVTLSYVLSQLLENRNTVYMIDKIIRYVELHDSKDGKFLADEEFRSIVEEEGLTNIYENIDKYEGIDCGEIIEVLKIRKRVNRLVVTANVEAKEWKFKSKFFSSDIHVVDKNYKRKFIIPNDYDKYDELYQKLLNYKKSKNVL